MSRGLFGFEWGFVVFFYLFIWLVDCFWGCFTNLITMAVFSVKGRAGGTV